MPSLHDKLQNREANNFDFLRFFAAGCVILYHCYPLRNIPTEPVAELTGYMGLGQLGVSIFFFMSGLLVTRSWQNQPSLAAFTRKRCLRIFPGLLSMSLFCVLLVGPLGTELPLATYFTNGGTWKFLLNTLAPAHVYFIPGVFRHNPLVAMNGSLWTLPLELGCYLAVLVCGRLGLLTRKLFPLVFAAVLLYILRPYLVLGWHGVDLTGACLSNRRLCCVYFLLGAAAWVYGRHLPVNGWLAFLAAALCLATLSTGLLGYAVSFFSIPYLVLYGALTPLPPLNRWAKRGDLSFGMYIYAFPIQQLVVHEFGTRIGLGTLFTSSLLLTMAAAYLSWHFVEKPAIGWHWGTTRKGVHGTFASCAS